MPGEIAPLEATYRQAREIQSMAKGMADHSETVIAVETEQNREALLAEWTAQRPAAHANARTVLDGPGRIGLKLPAVNRAKEALGRWSVRWQPIIPAMPTGHADIARFADRADDTPRIYKAVDDYARRRAESRYPEHQHHAADAAATDRGVREAWLQLRETQRRHQHQLGDFGRLGHTATPEQHFAQIEQQIAAAKQQLAETREQIAQLEHSLATTQLDAVDGHLGRTNNHPVRVDQPSDPVDAARTNWSAERVTKQQAAQQATAHRIAVASIASEQEHRETWREHDPGRSQALPGHGVDR